MEALGLAEEAYVIPRQIRKRLDKVIEINLKRFVTAENWNNYMHDNHERQEETAHAVFDLVLSEIAKYAQVRSKDVS